MDLLNQYNIFSFLRTSDVNNNIEFNYFACIFPVFKGVIPNGFKCLLPPESLLNGIMLRQDEVDVSVYSHSDRVAGRETYNRDLPAGETKGSSPA